MYQNQCQSLTGIYHGIGIFCLYTDMVLYNSNVCRNATVTWNDFSYPCPHVSFWSQTLCEDFYVICIGDILLGFPKVVSCVDSLLLYSSHSKHLVLGQFLALWPCSWHWKHLSSLFDIMWTLDGGVMVAISCCTALSFSTSDIVLLSICSPLSYMWVAKLWAFFSPLMNILIAATSLVKLHLLASVLNQCTYAARDSFSHCWISMNCEVYVWISALQNFSLNKPFISFHDLFKGIASVTRVHIKPHDFALACLALLSLVRSAAISMPMSQSSNLVESCSLKQIYPALRSLSGWIVSVWNTRCLCTGIIFLQEVQQVQAYVAHGWQLTDFEVLAVCHPGSLLDDLLLLLLFAISHLFLL